MKRLVQRIIPHPFLTAVLLVMWLLLQQSASFGNILLGLVIAFAAGAMMERLEPQPIKIKKFWLLFPLFYHVLSDIVRSNFAVAWIILRHDKIVDTSGFLEIPLDLEDEFALTILSVIVTSTPGTAWLEYYRKDKILLLHVLDLVDEQAWIDTIKNRYERPLMEIFS